jgi:hypothetical protein
MIPSRIIAISETQMREALHALVDGLVNPYQHSDLK